MACENDEAALMLVVMVDYVIQPESHIQSAKTTGLGGDE